jgi:hypothetical protein
VSGGVLARVSGLGFSGRGRTEEIECVHEERPSWAKRLDDRLLILAMNWVHSRIVNAGFFEAQPQSGGALEAI